jgi:hypothetical protein
MKCVQNNFPENGLKTSRSCKTCLNERGYWQTGAADANDSLLN